MIFIVVLRSPNFYAGFILSFLYYFIIFYANRFEERMYSISIVQSWCTKKADKVRILKIGLTKEF